LIAMPGLPVKTAEQTASRFKQDIFNKVKAPKNLAVEVAVLVAQYPINDSVFTTVSKEVENLLQLVCNKTHTV